MADDHDILSCFDEFGDGAANEMFIGLHVGDDGISADGGEVQAYGLVVMALKQISHIFEGGRGVPCARDENDCWPGHGG